MVSWVVYIAIGLVIGGAAGFFLGRLDDFSQKERRSMQDRLDQADKEMAEYKHKVTEHFIATAGLVNNLTESYQAVHEHLAKGAQSLCDHQVAVNRLEVTRPVVIESRNEDAEESNESGKNIGVEPGISESQKWPGDAGNAHDKAASQTVEGETTVSAETGVVTEGAGRNSARTTEAKPSRSRTTESPAQKTGSRADAKTASSGEAAVGDQNDLTMASRMVH